MIGVNRPRMRMAEFATPPTDEENLLLFYDTYGNRFFEREGILQAAYLANKKLVTNGSVTLNDIFDFLHLPRIPTGKHLGWIASDVSWLNINCMPMLFEGEMCFQIIFDPNPQIIQASL